MKDFHIVIGKGGVRFDLTFKANSPVEGLDKLFKFIRGCAVITAYTGNPKGSKEALAGFTTYPELTGKYIFEHLKPAPINQPPALPGDLARSDENSPADASVQTKSDRDALNTAKHEEARLKRLAEQQKKDAARPEGTAKPGPKPGRKTGKKLPPAPGDGPEDAPASEEPMANDSPSFSPADPNQTPQPEQ